MPGVSPSTSVNGPDASHAREVCVFVQVHSCRRVYVGTVKVGETAVLKSIFLCSD